MGRVTLEEADNRVWADAMAMGVARSRFAAAERKYLKSREIRDDMRKKLQVPTSAASVSTVEKRKR